MKPLRVIIQEGILSFHVVLQTSSLYLYKHSTELEKLQRAYQRGLPGALSWLELQLAMRGRLQHGHRKWHRTNIMSTFLFFIYLPIYISCIYWLIDHWPIYDLSTYNLSSFNQLSSIYLSIYLSLPTDTIGVIYQSFAYQSSIIYKPTYHVSITYHPSINHLYLPNDTTSIMSICIYHLSTYHVTFSYYPSTNHLFISIYLPKPYNLSIIYLYLSSIYLYLYLELKVFYIHTYADKLLKSHITTGPVIRILPSRLITHQF